MGYLLYSSSIFQSLNESRPKEGVPGTSENWLQKQGRKEEHLG